MKKLVITLTLMLAALLPVAAWAGDFGVGYRHGSSSGHGYGGHYSYSGGGNHSYGFGFGGHSYSSGFHYSPGHSSYGGSHVSSYGGRGYSGGYSHGGGRNYSYYDGHSNHGGNYNHGNYHHTTYTSTEPERRYHYRVGYRDGGSPYPFHFYRVGYSRYDQNGYTGSYGQDNHQHRADYETYMKRINYEARNGTYAGEDGDIEPAAGPVAAKSGTVCGNWERGNEACRVQGTTRRWEPWMVVYNQ